MSFTRVMSPTTPRLAARSDSSMRRIVCGLSGRVLLTFTSREQVAHMARAALLRGYRRSHKALQRCLFTKRSRHSKPSTWRQLDVSKFGRLVLDRGWFRLRHGDTRRCPIVKQ